MNEEWRNEIVAKGAAVDALNEVMIAYIPRLYGKLEEIPLECAMAIIKMPPAQPEIIRCRECKHMQEDKIFHQCWCNGREVKPDHFCGYAERKEDE